MSCKKAKHAQLRVYLIDGILQSSEKSSRLSLWYLFSNFPPSQRPTHTKLLCLFFISYICVVCRMLMSRSIVDLNTMNEFSSRLFVAPLGRRAAFWEGPWLSLVTEVTPTGRKFVAKLKSGHVIQSRIQSLRPSRTWPVNWLLITWSVIITGYINKKRFTSNSWATL